MRARVGVYVCHCGINIAATVDVGAVAAFAQTLRDVVVAKEYTYMCSDPGQELIKDDIREQGLTHVVVASCSPRMHEYTFRSAVARGGLNPFRAFHHLYTIERQLAALRAIRNRLTDDGIAEIVAVLLFVALTATFVPIAFYFNHRFASSESGEGSVRAVRQSGLAALFLVLCTWLRMIRSLNWAVALLVLVLLVSIEVIILTRR